jgi:two-component system, NarL family, nitrate/nitrite response regulator NarL
MASAARNDARVAIVDDHVSVAEALELALGAEGYDVRRVEVPDAPTTPRVLVAAIAQLDPHVVLLNLDLGPFGDGAPLVAPLAKDGANVVVLTGLTDRVRWGEVLAAGARTVLSKSQPLHDIIATVRRIHLGQPVIERADRDALVEVWARHLEDHAGVHERFARLTSREREVLGQLMLGRAVREIATHAVVSEATVRTQVKSILSKLEVSSQLAAVGLAHRVGWRAPDPAAQRASC